MKRYQKMHLPRLARWSACWRVWPEASWKKGRPERKGRKGRPRNGKKTLMISFIMLMIDQSVMTMNINDKYYGMFIFEPHINSDKWDTFGCKAWMNDSIFEPVRNMISASVDLARQSLLVPSALVELNSSEVLASGGLQAAGFMISLFFFEGWGEKDHGVLKHVREEAGALKPMGNGTKPKMPFTTLDCLVVFFASSIFGMMILNDIVLVEITKTTNQWTGLALCCGSDVPVPLCGSHVTLVTLTSKQFQSQFFLCCLELVIEFLTCQSHKSQVFIIINVAFGISLPKIVYTQDFGFVRSLVDM